MKALVKKVKQFVLGSIGEAKKVTWPGRKQLFEHSVVVIVALLICVGAIAAIDFGFNFLVKTYILGVM
ncbi:preprotein translocase subunit SecE [Patescibacteria group bacterium]|jgi:preprotein translocase SecE subunit|nr:preprotein translocase subunit SecE [Patescibacteria group bacterium]